MNYGKHFRGIRFRQLKFAAVAVILAAAVLAVGMFYKNAVTGVGSGAEDAEAAIQGQNDGKQVIPEAVSAQQAVENKPEKQTSAAVHKFEETDRLTDHLFAERSVPEALESSSLIDIKLFKAGAEDAVVVSKATVMERNGNLLSFFLNAEEQEYLKEASNEGQLFVVLYADPFQSPSPVTYLPGYMKHPAAQ